MTDQTPCCSTRHCADHGWCHRCNPTLAEASRHVLRAMDAAGIAHDGRVYAAVMAAIAGRTPGPAVMPVADAEQAALAARITAERDRAATAAANARDESVARVNEGMAAGLDIALRILNAQPEPAAPAPVDEDRRTHDSDGACVLDCPPVGDPSPCPCTPGVLDRRQRYDHALRTTPRADCIDFPPNGPHGPDGHRYDARCALCTGDTGALAADLRERLRKAEQEANATATAAAHLTTLARQRAERAEAAVNRALRRLDTWKQRLPETVRTTTVIETLRADLATERTQP